MRNLLRHFLFPVLLPVILATTLADAATLPRATPTTAPVFTSRFAAGDAAFRERRTDARAREALRQYRDLYADDPSDVDAAWRLAMADYFVGLRVAQDPAEKTELFAEGRDAAIFGTKRDPSCAACHFWAATNMALYGEQVGVLKMLFSLREIQEHLRATIALEPSYMSSGAYRILGLIDQKLPGILGGSNARAREEFEKAVAGSPGEPLNYLFLSRFYRDELHDETRARQAVAAGLAIRDLAPERLESREAQAELRQLIP